MNRFALACTVAALTLAVTAPALAFNPGLPVQGVLRNQGGGPVADGVYVLTFRLYDSDKAPQPLYKETHLGVNVAAGAFATVIGLEDPAAPLPDGIFAKNPGLWVGVSVQADPELPRAALRPVPYAWHSGTADSLAQPISPSLVSFAYAGSDSKGGAALALKCTGCVTAEMLAPGALDAKNVTLQQGQKATTVDAAFAALGSVLKLGDASVGIAKAPAKGCAIDVASDGGLACLDGQPATWVVHVASQADMEKLGAVGSVAYRTDTGETWVKAKGKWRKVAYASVCGDGAVDPPEQCDDGANNAKQPDKCRPDCVLPKCGDSIQDKTEACDDGNTSDNDGCVKCTLAKCGDGFIQLGVEQCDDGAANANAPDKCRLKCLKPACGDSIVDNGEGCDDGNKLDNDGCSAACQTPPKPLVWSAVVTNNQTPTIDMGSIPGKAGKKIQILKIGLCGDSDQGSGPNQFRASGGGVNISWQAGQAAGAPPPTASTYTLATTPIVNGNQHGFSYQAVNHTASDGASVKIEWTYHYDWDGHWCGATDSEGNTYGNGTGDVGSSLRAWVLYQYL